MGFKCTVAINVFAIERCTEVAACEKLNVGTVHRGRHLSGKENDASDGLQGGL